MSDWFTSLANQAIQFADNLADSLVTQAAEAQHQIEVEQNKIKTEEFQKESILTHLPWETSVESYAIFSQELMENIFKLSVHDNNFCTMSANTKDVLFNFQEFVPTAMKLLELDSNLARTHSKLSPKMDEEIFWFNYYCRVTYLRHMSGIDGVHAKLVASEYNVNDVIASTSLVTTADAKIIGISGMKSRGGCADSPILQSTDPHVHIDDHEKIESGKGDHERDEDDLDLGDLNCGDLDELDMLDLGDLDDEDDDDTTWGKTTKKASDQILYADQRQQCAASVGTASSTVTDFEKVQTEDCRPSSSDSGADDIDSDAELEAQIARELAAENV